MIGTLKIQVGVTSSTQGKLVTVYTTTCTREAADIELTQFKSMNPDLKEAIALVSWQAEAEYL